MPTELEAWAKAGEIVTFLGSVAFLTYRMGRMTQKFESIGEQQAKEITDLKETVAKLGVLMIDVAVQKRRLDDQDARFTLMDKRYEDLRRGIGRIE